MNSTLSYQLVSIESSQNICAAHRLLGHPGKCGRLHGHNYKITYTLTKNSMDAQNDGMVLDFSEVKKVVFAMVDDMFDHKTILQEGDPLIHVLPLAQGEDSIYVMPYRPTAEMMAAHLLAIVGDFLKDKYDNTVSLLNVTVEETPGNSASAQSVFVQEEENKESGNE